MTLSRQITPLPNGSTPEVLSVQPTELVNVLRDVAGVYNGMQGPGEMAIAPMPISPHFTLFIS